MVVNDGRAYLSSRVEQERRRQRAEKPLSRLQTKIWRITDHQVAGALVVLIMVGLWNGWVQGIVDWILKWLWGLVEFDIGLL